MGFWGFVKITHKMQLSGSTTKPNPQSSKNGTTLPMIFKNNFPPFHNLVKIVQKSYFWALGNQPPKCPQVRTQKKPDPQSSKNVHLSLWFFKKEFSTISQFCQKFVKIIFLRLEKSTPKKTLSRMNIVGDLGGWVFCRLGFWKNCDFGGLWKSHTKCD